MGPVVHFLPRMFFQNKVTNGDIRPRQTAGPALLESMLFPEFGRWQLILTSIYNVN